MRLSLSLLLVGSCAFLVVEGLPSGEHSRLKRQATKDNATTEVKSTEGSSTTTQPTPSSSDSSSSSSTSESPQSNEFGLGAVAGIGGLRRGVGIGNFQFPTQTDAKNDPLSPWGAFAGLNLGNGGRIGAGCQGLSCGVQLGHFVLGTPQLLGLGRNILNPQQKNGPDGAMNETEGKLDQQQADNAGDSTQSFLKDVQSFTDDQLAKLREQQKEFREDSLADFARIRSRIFGNGNGDQHQGSNGDSAIGAVGGAGGVADATKKEP